MKLARLSLPASHLDSENVILRLNCSKTVVNESVSFAEILQCFSKAGAYTLNLSRPLFITSISLIA